MLSNSNEYHRNNCSHYKLLFSTPPGLPPESADLALQLRHQDRVNVRHVLTLAGQVLVLHLQPSNVYINIYNYLLSIILSVCISLSPKCVTNKYLFLSI